MKISIYAKQLGISYQTVWRLFRDGKLNAYKLPTRTVVVREDPSEEANGSVAVYCRVSSSENKEKVPPAVFRAESSTTAGIRPAMREYI